MSSSFERITRYAKLSGRRNSLRLERYYWDALDSLAKARGQTTNELIEALERQNAAALRGGASMASVLRVFVADQHRALAALRQRMPAAAEG
ncbi:MAG TPA: ribbon-helix-helix domain-containing protein [Azospirillum sp.]|nr:ribbon-helix-helix domain-containing protein [Azospirillum sp.]